MIRLFVAVLFVAFAATQAGARNDNGQWTVNPMHAWFDQLHSHRGALCCSDTDGNVINNPDWDNQGTITDINSGYRVRLKGKWVDVPKDAIVEQPNKFGAPVVWASQDVIGDWNIRCFLPGAVI